MHFINGVGNVDFSIRYINNKLFPFPVQLKERFFYFFKSSVIVYDWLKHEKGYKIFNKDLINWDNALENFFYILCYL